MSLPNDYLTNFESPMFGMVDPNDICPMIDVFDKVNDQFMGSTFYSTGNPQSSSASFQPQPLQPIQHNHQPLALEYEQEQQPTTALVQQNPVAVQVQQVTDQYQLAVYQATPFSGSIGPPPSLPAHEEPKYKIRQQLQLRRVLSQQRQERLRAKLESQPPQFTQDIMHKGTGKKVTGRERQQELEKEERRQLQLRDHYLKVIDQLERKCNKLREILENIVSTSPEYNAQMINFLESSDLLYDREAQLPPTILTMEQEITMPSTTSDSNNESENRENHENYVYQE